MNINITKEPKNKTKERKKLACNMNENKNRRKAIFNRAAKGQFFLRGGGGYTHSG